MEKSFFIFMLLFVFEAASQGILNWVRIDCGSQTSHYDQNGLLWETDDKFIKTGENKQISSNSPTLLDQLKTLRIFTEQNKNCYSLPAPTLDRYFIRAMFQYGNYDGLSAPPTFDIQIDGNFWDTVETSMTVAQYYEVIYTSKGQNISVCVSRTTEQQFPFISMLEAWPLPDKTYAIMSRDMAWIKKYRYNYGVSLILGYPADTLNRIWIPMIPSGVVAVNATFSSLDYTTVNEPPDQVIIETVQAGTPESSIILPFTFKELNPMHQVLAYFTEIDDSVNDTRSFNLLVNMDFKFNITPQYQNCTGYMMNIQSFGSLNVELMPNLDSTLPPTISAIEVYNGINPVVTFTSQDDLDGLAVLINAFEQLEGWTGDPCLPSNTVWQWLGCTGNDPPRVTSLDLVGYGLKGPLPDFSKMQALQSIDLSNNSLNGSIPDFLGKLPNLEQLDLRDNLFTGGLPQSILDNKNLTFYADWNNGNQNLQQPKKKNAALITGLAVGLPLGLILVVVLAALLYHLRKKKTAFSQGQGIAMSTSGQEGGAPQGHSQQENGSVTISTETFVRPSHPLQHITPLPSGENLATPPSIESMNANQHIHADEHYAQTADTKQDIPVNDSPGITNHPSMMQDIDEEELRELLRQHGSSGAPERS